jgi:hypothetical protein
MMRNGLRRIRAKVESTEGIPTSLFSRGVPLIGTRAFTGNDSGCSGILQASGKRTCRVIHESIERTWMLPR